MLHNRARYHVNVSESDTVNSELRIRVLVLTETLRILFSKPHIFFYQHLILFDR